MKPNGGGVLVAAMLDPLQESLESKDQAPKD